MPRRLIWAASAAVATLLAGCSQPAPDQAAQAPPPPKPDAKLTPSLQPGTSAGGKYVLFITNASSPFWDSVETGMKKGADEAGVQAKMERNTGETAGQIGLLEQALAKKDELLGVAVSVYQADADGITAAMAKLKAAGVHVITVDSDGKPDSREAFIGTNNLEAGKQLGQKAKELIPAGGKFCAFVGTKSAQNARDRLAGFKQGAGEKFVELEVYEDSADPSKARSNAETALQSHADASVVLGIWSYNGPALGDTIKTAGKLDKVKVISFDAEPNLLPLLENGTVLVSCVQRPYEFGRQGVKLLAALGKGDKAAADALLKGKDVLDTGVDIVTKANYAEFKKGLDEKGLKGS